MFRLRSEFTESLYILMQAVTRSYIVPPVLSVPTLSYTRLAQGIELHSRHYYARNYRGNGVFAIRANVGSSLPTTRQQQWQPYQLRFRRYQFQTSGNSIRQMVTWGRTKIRWKVRNTTAVPTDLGPNAKQEGEETRKIGRWNLYKRLHSSIKWLLIRDKTRPFSKDERGTLFSWLVISQIIWIILKTTTVVSLLLLGFNTIFAKGLVAQTIGRLLSYFNSDVDIEFQDALIPEWKSGFIKFSNVKVRTKSSQKNNILCFNLQFHQIEINLNMKKWIHGNGIIEEVKVFGMQGKIIVNYPEQQKPLEPLTKPPPAQYERNADNEHRSGYYRSLWQEEKSSSESSRPVLIDWFTNKDYILRNVSVRDSHFTLIERVTGSQGKPLEYTISIFNLSIPSLNFNHLLVDFLKADVVTGSINNSLFSFHKRQHKLSYISGLKDDLSPWERITRIRLNPIDVNELGLTNTAAFNWISDGTVGIVADLMLPREAPNDDSDRYLVIDLKFEFNDLKARLPANNPTLSTGESILSVNELKPVVSFVNLRRLLAVSQWNKNGGNHESTAESHSPTNGGSYASDGGSPIVSIKHKKSYPSVTVLQSVGSGGSSDNESKSATTDKMGGDRETVSIIKFHDSKSGGGSNYFVSYDEISPYTRSRRLSQDPSKLVLHCRLAKSIKDLNGFVLFGETDIFDDLCMELYIDLLKTVEEWDLKNSDEWLRNWGASFGSQLLLFGFANFL